MPDFGLFNRRRHTPPPLMFPEAIQFQLSDAARDLKVLLPHQLLCMRQTSRTLEFLWGKRSGSTAVVCVEGYNLGILRRELLCGARNTILLGPCGPGWSRCKVTRIYHRLGWTIPKAPLAPDPNPLPMEYLQMETGLTRDLWTRDTLDSFAIPRGKIEKLLLQFHGNHAYILETIAGTFVQRLTELKEANFTYAMTNRFSAFAHNPYPPFPAICLERYTFAKIVYAEKDLASKSEWEVILDYRRAESPRPSIAI